MASLEDILYHKMYDDEILDQALADEELIVERGVILDENGVDIFKKKSAEKTVEERIQTSRSLKIKYNKWNQVDFNEEKKPEKITIDNEYSQQMTSVEDKKFEKEFHEIIKNSRFKAILLDRELDRVVINYQIINEILLYTFARMKNDYSLSKIYVMVCEYCGINIQTMWKRLSSYIRKTILEELCEYNNLPKSELDEGNQLF